MIIFMAALTLVYAVVLLFLLYGFHQIEEESPAEGALKTTFSVVVPFRNEAENLPRLFESFRKLKYPKNLFEVWLVNDASEDNSEEICREFLKANPNLNLKILQNRRRTGSPKKDALQTGIEQSQNKFIITTDADCEVQQKWLNSFSKHIEKSDAQFISGPVKLENKGDSKRSFLELFQQLDFFSLQAATIGGFGGKMPFLCNGANLCYEKAAFDLVAGFTGNENIASGDDIFLLEKLQEKGLKTSFLKDKNAVVSTLPQASLRALIEQRKRWAGKTSATKNSATKGIGLLVLLMNAALLIAGLGVVLEKVPSELFFLMFLVKFNVDFVLIYAAAHFFGSESILKNYFWCSLVYPFFSSYAGIASIFGGYKWKGRHFKK